MGKRKPKPLSESQKLKKLVDWLFDQIVSILSKKVVKIFKVRRIGSIYGGILTSGQTHFNFSRDGQIRAAVIFLSANEKHHTNGNIANTLVHEALHLLLPTVRESGIRRLEFQSWLKQQLFLWHLFNEKQQKAISSFVPRRIVKRPSPMAI